MKIVKDFWVDPKTGDEHYEHCAVIEGEAYTARVCRPRIELERGYVMGLEEIEVRLRSIMLSHIKSVLYRGVK